MLQAFSMQGLEFLIFENLNLTTDYLYAIQYDHLDLPFTHHSHSLLYPSDPFHGHPLRTLLKHLPHDIPEQPASVLPGRLRLQAPLLLVYGCDQAHVVGGGEQEAQGVVGRVERVGREGTGRLEDGRALRLKGRTRRVAQTRIQVGLAVAWQTGICLLKQGRKVDRHNDR